MPEPAPEAPPGAGGDAARLEGLLEAALARPPAERAAWLAAAAPTPALRSRARRLLERVEHLGDFLEQPADLVVPGAPAADARTSVATGTAAWRSVGGPLPGSIGPYRVVGLLGEGGMGVVYLAEQSEPVERQLAVKVLRASLATAGAAARFEAERRVLARLAHPNVAQLYEAGTTADGHPYFAMERVPGRPITRACDRERLTIEERLGLFSRVCDGVQHAHQKGIIHRDLKPSNVLVARLGEWLVPKIIDFGIARTLDAEGTFGETVGTPAYMSPESFADSAAGDADTRADVYSLGVVLYELLTGERPFDSRGASPAELLYTAAHREAPKPSARIAALSPAEAEEHARRRRLDRRSLERRLRGDLDAIVVRAVARSPADRYASVAELASDLARHLRHEPVVAAKADLRYRLAKLARRHRAGLAAALVVLLAMAAGAVGTTVGMIRAREEAEAARRAQAEAEEFSLLLADIMQDFSLFLTGRLDAGLPASPAAGPPRAHVLLSRGADEIRNRFEHQPATRARLLHRVAEMYLELGLGAEARKLLEESLTLLEALPEADPEQLAAVRRSLERLARRQPGPAERP